MRFQPLWFSALVVTALGCEAPAPSMAHVVHDQLARRPESDVADVYAMLFHGLLGPAHGAVDSAGAAVWLLREVATLSAGPGEPIAEPLRSDSSVVRVNLRPYFAAGGSPDALLSGFLQSGREIIPEPTWMTAALRELEGMASRGEVPWAEASVRSLVVADSHEVLPHSARYLETYRPAYRILSRESLLRSLPEPVRAHVFETPPPPFPTGRFVDDYGGRHEVLPDEWRQGATARYHIVAWQPVARYLLARNDSSNTTDPGRYTRIDWISLDMPPYTWAFCFSAYNAPTLAAAESVSVARPDAPRTGCNGFPFSRLRPDTAVAR